MLGDFIDARPTLLQALKADLAQIEQRLAALEAGTAPTAGNFHFVSADPAAFLGVDGDAALHTGTGELWRKSAGAWATTGLSLWGK